MIDTGPSSLAARTIHGYASNVRPTNELLAINTELHVDHLLGNSVFRDLGVPLWGHVLRQRSADALELNAEEFDATVPGPGWRSR